MIFYLKDLINHCSSMSVCIDGEYVPCRPSSGDFLFHKLKAAWMVFTGKADAVIWPKGQ